MAELSITTEKSKVHKAQYSHTLVGAIGTFCIIEFSLW